MVSKMRIGNQYWFNDFNDETNEYLGTFLGELTSICPLNKEESYVGINYFDNYFNEETGTYINSTELFSTKLEALKALVKIAQASVVYRKEKVEKARSWVKNCKEEVKSEQLTQERGNL